MAAGVGNGGAGGRGRVGGGSQGQAALQGGSTLIGVCGSTCNRVGDCGRRTGHGWVCQRGPAAWAVAVAPGRWQHMLTAGGGRWQLAWAACGAFGGRQVVGLVLLAGSMWGCHRCFTHCTLLERTPPLRIARQHP